MSAATWVAFLVAAAGGAAARVLLDGYVQARAGGRFPWGTLAVNATGSLALGVLTGLGLHHGLAPSVRTVIGTGACGAFTTFSTFAVDTLDLAEGGAPRAAVLNVALNLVVGTGLAGLGLALTLR